MRKYLFIFKTQIMTNLQYVFNLFVGFIGYFVMLFILFNLWEYLYSDPNELINGYSMTSMMWYVVITEILYSVVGGRTLCKKISNDVKSGNVAYNINKPYSYIGYSVSSHFGSMFIKFIMYFILGIGFGLLFIGKLPNLSLVSIIFLLVSMFLGLLISTLLILSIGLFSFYIEDSGPFYWVYSKLILVMGTLFPIEYFPSIVQKILVYTPVYVVNYGPAKLFVDFNIYKGIEIIIAQIIYVIIAYLICNFIYRKGVRRINVNGG